MNSQELIENENAKTDATNGEYELHYSIKESDVVVDLGGHFGYFAEHIANRCSQVVSFEPHPVNFQQLNLRTSSVSNVFTHNLAAWNSYEELELWEYPGHSGGHSLFKERIPASFGRKVQAVDIGDFLKRNNIIPSFIKIDTENAEANVLESLFRHEVKVPMAIECHDADLYRHCKLMVEQNGMKFLPEDVHVGVCYVVKG